MARVRLLDRVHRERANRVDGELVELGRGGGGAHSAPSIDSTRRRAVSRAASCAASTPAPITPASAPPRASETVTRRHRAGSARERGLVHGPLEVQVGGAREAAPDHHVLGLEDVHVAGDGHAEHAREAVEHPQGVGVALARQPSPARGPSPGRPRRAGGQVAVRHVAGELGGVALERLAAAVGLDAAAARDSCRGTAAPPGRS